MSPLTPAAGAAGVFGRPTPLAPPEGLRMRPNELWRGETEGAIPPGEPQKVSAPASRLTPPAGSPSHHEPHGPRPGAQILPDAPDILEATITVPDTLEELTAVWDEHPTIRMYLAPRFRNRTVWLELVPDSRLVVPSRTILRGSIAWQWDWRPCRWRVEFSNDWPACPARGWYRMRPIPCCPGDTLEFKIHLKLNRD